jgi:uncharacterized membrane protein AbrB (regulator of aidB expression)
MSRFDIIPGTTAVWGMLPGAAPLMMLMAEAYGADSRLVAFMQYLRVVMVAAVASLVSLMFVPSGGGRFSSGYFLPISLPDLAATAILAPIGGIVGLGLRIPAGVLLGQYRPRFPQKLPLLNAGGIVKAPLGTLLGGRSKDSIRHITRI